VELILELQIALEILWFQMIFIKSKATTNFTMNTSKLKKKDKLSNFFNQKEALLKWK